MLPSLLSIWLTLLVGIHLTFAGEWSYDEHGHHGKGPSQWKTVHGFEACGYKKQSPIDIKLSTATKSDIKEFEFNRYDVPVELSELKNNGHTVEWKINNSSQISLTEGGLPGRYQLVQFHVHWGGTDQSGSEHKVDGKSYPMEIHFVHFNADKYANISDAAAQIEGLAVLGIFVQVGDKGHETIERLLSRFHAVRFAGTNTSYTDLFKLNTLLPTRTNDFIRYSGSLTTPPCFESVIWTVFNNPITISRAQMNYFRVLSYGSGLTSDVPLQNNFRPVQPLNGRTVYRTFAVDNKPPSSSPPQLQSPLVLIVASLVVFHLRSRM